MTNNDILRLLSVIQVEIFDENIPISNELRHALSALLNHFEAEVRREDFEEIDKTSMETRGVAKMTNKYLLGRLIYINFMIEENPGSSLELRESVREVLSHFEAKVEQEEIDKTSMENTGLLCPKAKDIIYK